MAGMRIKLEARRLGPFDEFLRFDGLDIFCLNDRQNVGEQLHLFADRSTAFSAAASDHRR
jgi:hypothetical protein